MEGVERHRSSPERDIASAMETFCSLKRSVAVCDPCMGTDGKGASVYPEVEPKMRAYAHCLA